MIAHFLLVPVIACSSEGQSSDFNHFVLISFRLVRARTHEVAAKL